MQEKESIMVARCGLKIPSLGITFRITRPVSWCRTVTLVTEFSIIIKRFWHRGSCWHVLDCIANVTRLGNNIVCCCFSGFLFFVVFFFFLSIDKICNAVFPVQERNNLILEKYVTMVPVHVSEVYHWCRSHLLIFSLPKVSMKRTCGVIKHIDYWVTGYDVAVDIHHAF